MQLSLPLFALQGASRQNAQTFLFSPAQLMSDLAGLARVDVMSNKENVEVSRSVRSLHDKSPMFRPFKGPSHAHFT